MSKRALMLDDEQLNEKFASKKQQGLFYAKCGKGKTKEQKKWCKMAKEFSDDMTKKDWKKLPEKVKEESLSENKIVSLIKEKENPRMTKKDLLEYIKSRKVVKKVTKGDMIFEQRNERDITDYTRWFDPRERRVLNAYLLKLRDSGLENMFGVAPILNWTQEDLHRYLYGKRMDLESLESHSDYEDYWDGDDEDDSGRNEELIEIIRYLLKNKQEIRDILIRAALRRAEADGDDYSDSRITSYFHQAASDALRMYMKSFG